jgi:hypothetical protein
MTLLPAGVKVNLAFGFIDMRNYAEGTIMLSPGQSAEYARF